MQSHLNRTAQVALHLRWFTAEKFKNYETVKGSCILSTPKLKKTKRIRYGGSLLI